MIKIYVLKVILLDTIFLII